MKGHIFSYFSYPFVSTMKPSQASCSRYSEHEAAGLDESPQSRKTKSKNSNSGFPLNQWEVVALGTIFMTFLLGLATIYFTMPNVDRKVFKFPQNVEELRSLTEFLSTYAQDHTMQVVLGYFATYIFMQTFMIPGTFVLSLLAGSLFGVLRGGILVILAATAGASSCFFLSKLVGRPIANWMWPEKLSFFRNQVAARRKMLLNYMLFLRITPTLPNTFINAASPIVDVPYKTFFLATFFGLIPATFVTVRAGLTLGELKSFANLYDMKTLTTLFFIGLMSFVPILIGNKN
ncbi:hypothetical protein O6H91_03G041900 [Diphasiastrum complanatum]|uniref:Uncharacterized protein n=2 Tax=Diphasiastrum complanatum TaxID=34168 RepID=A0ACC2E5L6_DIPCM|nr:hypothetical protein O6H91_Y418500 [Diphasiastrum complanatum]KAJ7561806.1 hypothetical protein O6H91_03G041900 [Diphasiastrum complanatum]KAJ7561807.1 hypothetical protein O6H91_03G041900 [Diphasiastrum complanatum]